MRTQRSFRPTKRRQPGTVAAMVTTVVDQLGGLKKVAHHVDRSVTTVASYTDPDAPVRITLDTALAMTRAGSDGFARQFALEAGGIFVPLNQAKTSVHDAVASLTEAAASVASTTIRALADGRFTPAEAADALRDLDRAAESLVCARARVREAMETTP